jgi:gluconolactonase
MSQDIRVIADGLAFPEGPVAMPDGSVLLVEIIAGVLTRVWPDGRKETVARTGGGPNGAAIGPDGKCYICNNGGSPPRDLGGGIVVPGHYPEHGIDGSIQRVDLATGAVETLYSEVGGHKLSAPNDIVFDAHGGFWFTDFGQMKARSKAFGGIYYAKADGSFIEEVVYHLDNPNGIGLSPDGATLYVAESFSGHVLAFKLSGPGKIERAASIMPHGGSILGRAGAGWVLDSLAVDSAGYVCVGGASLGGILAFAPDGSEVVMIRLPDPMTTNICFGGPDLRTAYVTCCAQGQLVAFDWMRPGLRLNYAPG